MWCMSRVLSESITFALIKKGLSAMFVYLRHIFSSMRGAFLPYKPGSSAIPGGSVRPHDLSYYGIAYGKKNMRGDMARVGHDFKRATKAAKMEVKETE